MSAGKEKAWEAIDEKQTVFTELSDEIWEYAELSLQEYKSAGAFVRVLKQLGFEVTEGLSGLPTAFCGSWGSGKPVIGILGEFDALSGLSQEGGATEPKELVKGGNGHGCGHNMLGAGSLAAAYGIKEYLKASGRPGTVIFYGCPGEEGASGKAQMAKDGLWSKLDAAITWHPSDVNEVAVGTCNSCIQNLYIFHGVAAHAAGDPEDGRSALDAVELMNVGVQYLREHMKSDACIHYAMVNGGGYSPNVVQKEASVLYMVRSVLVKDALKLQARVDDVARGAALMTGTTFEKVFTDGCSNLVPNHTLDKVLYEALAGTPLPQYTPEEWAYAQAVKKTCPERDLPTMAAKCDPEAAELVARLSENGTRALNDFVSPLWGGAYVTHGSTDVGDVSWLTPTVQLHTASFVAGSPGHSWQHTSCGKTSIGHKGLLFAGKVMANMAVRLYEEPELLAEAKKEHEKSAAGGYFCPIPDGETVKALEM